MGNNQSKHKPYYKTAAITGTGGGIAGAAAVCVFVYSLPLSLSVVVIGGTAGLIGGLLTEHFWPSRSLKQAILKGSVIGFISGGAVYYISVKVAPDIVLSTKQLKVISGRAHSILKQGNLNPTSIITEQNSPTYVAQYKIKDPKTGYVVNIQETKNAIQIKMKYNPILGGIGKPMDLNHTYLEITDGKDIFITELTGPIKDGKWLTGVNRTNGMRDGTLFETYYADPNKCRTMNQAKELVSQAKIPWNKEMVYNCGDATCQHYCQDVINVLTNVSKENIPLKEKNTFKLVKVFDNSTRNIFNGNTDATHCSKNNTLANIKVTAELADGISNNGGNNIISTKAIVSIGVLAAGCVGYKVVQNNQHQINE